MKPRAILGLPPYPTVHYLDRQESELICVYYYIDLCLGRTFQFHQAKTLSWYQSQLTWCQPTDVHLDTYLRSDPCVYQRQSLKLRVKAALCTYQGTRKPSQILYEELNHQNIHLLNTEIPYGKNPH